MIWKFKVESGDFFSNTLNDNWEKITFGNVFKLYMCTRNIFHKFGMLISRMNFFLLYKPR